MRKIILSTLIGICGTAFAQDVSEINEKDIYNKYYDKYKLEIANSTLPGMKK